MHWTISTHWNLARVGLRELLQLLRLHSKGGGEETDEDKEADGVGVLRGRWKSASGLEQHTQARTNKRTHARAHTKDLSFDSLENCLNLLTQSGSAHHPCPRQSGVRV